MRKTLFIKNTAVLTFTSLVLRLAGIVFKVWLAGRLGADGIGLYSLVFSLFGVAAALVSSGLPVAVTRLVAERADSGHHPRRIVSAALCINLFISVLAGAVLFCGAKFLAATVIGDPRAALSIRVIAFSLLFMGISAVLRGYFIARRKTCPGAFSLLLGQATRIGFALAALRLSSGAGLHIACAAVFAGDVAAEVISGAYLYIRYRFDLKKAAPCPRPSGSARRLFSVSLPITAAKSLNGLLRAGENALVQKSLGRFSSRGALGVFGMIKGMALPVLLFPSVLLGAVSTLLVPEISEAAGNRKTYAVRAAVEEVICVSLCVGFIFSALFASAGQKIGNLLYKSADVGFLICALAPIVALMYLDSLCDGLLKGLNQQNFTFRVSVTDSLARLVLIFPVVSRFGVKGFIAIMYASNIATSLLNVRRLIKISGAAPDTQKTVVAPLLSAFCVTLLLKVVFDFFPLPDLVYIILLSATSVPLYLLLLFHFGSISFIIPGRMRRHKKYAAIKTATSLIK